MASRLPVRLFQKLLLSQRICHWSSYSHSELNQLYEILHEGFFRLVLWLFLFVFGLGYFVLFRGGGVCFVVVVVF